MCATVRDRKDGTTIWINNDPEPKCKELENVWDLIVQGPCDEVARHAAMQKWDDPVHKEVTNDELPKHKPSVVIGTPKKGIRNQGMLTPAQSPRIGPQSRLVPEDPASPSKSGRGATGLSQATNRTNAFEKLNGKSFTKSQTKRVTVQSKKIACVRNKATRAAKQTNTAITNTFKQKKSTTKVVPAKLTGKMAVVPMDENVDTIDLPKRSSSTPRHGGTQLTAFKTSDFRFNHLPERPQMEPFSSPVKARTPSEQIHQEANFHRMLQTSDSRPSTADSSSSRISIHNLLNPDPIS